MTSSFARSALAHLAAAALASTAVMIGAAKAQSPSIGAPSMLGAPAGAMVAQTVMVDLSGPVGAARSLDLPRGKSAVVELPVDAKDVIVSDPKVADVVLSTPRRIYVMGVSGGQTDAVFVDASGRQILRLAVRVDQDISALSETLNRVLPGAAVHIEAVNNSIILSGEVASAADADKAVRIAQTFVAEPKDILNMMGVAQPEQVMLKVRIIEVNRQIVKQLGVNLNALIGEIGGAQFNLANAASWGANGAFLGSAAAGYMLNTQQQPQLQFPCAILFPAQAALYPQGALCPFNVRGSNPKFSNGQPIANPGSAVPGSTVGSNGLNQANAMIQAFEQVGLVRTLAEPNLTAVSGESAKFLAGGEFPVPVGEDATGRITVEFKQFGVGLGFTPIVLSRGRISLKISTEYSELTNVGALTQGSVSSTSAATATTAAQTSTSPSFSVPALSVRRAETVVELPSGGAMMIAGLLESTTKQDISSLPGLMELPVLGSLFRSRDFQQKETELVVIVTPYLVKSARPDQLQSPADGLQIADDLSTTLLGRLNKGFNKPAAPPAGKTYQGPFGYVVE